MRVLGSAEGLDVSRQDAESADFVLTGDDAEAYSEAASPAARAAVLRRARLRAAVTASLRASRRDRGDRGGRDGADAGEAAGDDVVADDDAADFPASKRKGKTQTQSSSQSQSEDAAVKSDSSHSKRKSAAPATAPVPVLVTEAEMEADEDALLAEANTAAEAEAEADEVDEADEDEDADDVGETNFAFTRSAPGTIAADYETDADAAATANADAELFASDAEGDADTEFNPLASSASAGASAAAFLSRYSLGLYGDERAAVRRRLREPAGAVRQPDGSVVRRFEARHVRTLVLDEADYAVQRAHWRHTLLALLFAQELRRMQLAAGLRGLPKPTADWPYVAAPLRSVWVSATVTPLLLRVAAEALNNPYLITARAVSASPGAAPANFALSAVSLFDPEALRTHGPADAETESGGEHDSATDSETAPESAGVNPSTVGNRGGHLVSSRAVGGWGRFTSPLLLANIRRAVEAQRERLLPATLRHAVLPLAVPAHLLAAPAQVRGPELAAWVPLRFPGDAARAEALLVPSQGDERDGRGAGKGRDGKHGKHSKNNDNDKQQQQQSAALSKARSRDAAEEAENAAVELAALEARHPALAALGTLAAADANTVTRLLAALEPRCALVFVNEHARVPALAAALRAKGVAAVGLAAGSHRDERRRALAAARRGAVRVVVATNMVARGVDTSGVACVINLGAPEDPWSYVHRAGRVDRTRSQQQGALVLTVVQCPTGTRAAAAASGAHAAVRDMMREEQQQQQHGLVETHEHEQADDAVIDAEEAEEWGVLSDVDVNAIATADPGADAQVGGLEPAPADTATAMLSALPPRARSVLRAAAAVAAVRFRPTVLSHGHLLDLGSGALLRARPRRFLRLSTGLTVPEDHPAAVQAELAAAAERAAKGAARAADAADAAVLRAEQEAGLAPGAAADASAGLPAGPVIVPVKRGKRGGGLGVSREELAAPASTMAAAAEPAEPVVPASVVKARERAAEARSAAKAAAEASEAAFAAAAEAAAAPASAAADSAFAANMSFSIDTGVDAATGRRAADSHTAAADSTADADSTSAVALTTTLRGWQHGQPFTADGAVVPAAAPARRAHPAAGAAVFAASAESAPAAAAAAAAAAPASAASIDELAAGLSVSTGAEPGAAPYVVAPSAALRALEAAALLSGPPPRVAALIDTAADGADNATLAEAEAEADEGADAGDGADPEQRARWLLARAALKREAKAARRARQDEAAAARAAEVEAEAQRNRERTARRKEAERARKAAAAEADAARAARISEENAHNYNNFVRFNRTMDNNRNNNSNSNSNNSNSNSGRGSNGSDYKRPQKQQSQGPRDGKSTSSSSTSNSSRSAGSSRGSSDGGKGGFGGGYSASVRDVLFNEPPPVKAYNKGYGHGRGQGQGKGKSGSSSSSNGGGHNNKRDFWYSK